MEEEEEYEHRDFFAATHGGAYLAPAKAGLDDSANGEFNNSANGGFNGTARKTKKVVKKKKKKKKGTNGQSEFDGTVHDFR